MGVKLGVEGDQITAVVDFSAELAAAASAVESAAKELCPVDTGYLRSTITSEADKNTATISAGADYAAYVEFGTSKMAAQPYLVPALINSAGAVAAAFNTGGYENG